MSEESKKPDVYAICNTCNESKVRNAAGKFPNGRDTKYVNEKERSWSGKKCPDCQRTKMNKHMKAKRSTDLQ